MKRFLLFAYDVSYPQGGFQDYVEGFDYVQEVVLWLQAIKGADITKVNDEQAKVYYKDIVQVVDTETMKVYNADWYNSEDYRLFSEINLTNN